MIHEAESCTIVYYRREDGGRREDRTAAAIPKTHSPPSALLSRPAAPSVPLCCHECRGLARAFNVSTESEPMTGRNRDAETMLPFSHLNESPLPPPPLSLPLSLPRHYRADPDQHSLPPARFSPLSLPRPFSVFFDYCYFRPSVTSGIDNGYH